MSIVVLNLRIEVFELRLFFVYLELGVLEVNKGQDFALSQGLVQGEVRPICDPYF